MNALIALLFLAQPQTDATVESGVEWLWGGPTRDFRLPPRSLAVEWPPGGPTRIWSRALGGGHAGLAVGGSTVFTLLRRGEEEVAVALDAATGDTVWSSAESVPERELAYGMGPFATPLVDRERVFFVGGTGILRAHRRADGERLWRRDLARDFPGPRPDRGFAPSPILAEGLLVVPVGAPGAAVVALDPDDGRVRWRRHDHGFDYASPIAVRVANGRQLVCHMEEEVIGIDPRTGDLLWAVSSPSERTQHVIGPLELGSGETLVSTTYGVERLTIAPDGARLQWSSRRIKAQVGNLLFLPRHDVVLGASSASTGSPLVALDASTGETLWRERGVECGFLFAVGESLVALDREGVLVHARADRAGLQVLGRRRVLAGERVWSAPAISGNTLFLEDQDRILALDLGE